MKRILLVFLLAVACATLCAAPAMASGPPMFDKTAVGSEGALAVTDACSDAREEGLAIQLIVIDLTYHPEDVAIIVICGQREKSWDSHKGSTYSLMIVRQPDAMKSAVRLCAVGGTSSPVEIELISRGGYVGERVV